MLVREVRGRQERGRQEEEGNIQRRVVKTIRSGGEEVADSCTLFPSPTEAGGTTVYPGASRVIPVHGPGCEIFFPEEFRPSHYLVW